MRLITVISDRKHNFFLCIMFPNKLIEMCKKIVRKELRIKCVKIEYQPNE